MTQVSGIDDAIAPPPPAVAHALPEDGLDLKAHLAALERRMISAALDRSGGVVQKAADDLGIRRTTLVEKIQRYELRTRDTVPAGRDVEAT